METTTKASPPPAEPKLWGLLAEYPDPDSLKVAAAKIRDAGFKRWDCCTPYPVHGLDKAMGVRPTILPWIVLGAGLTGATVAVLLQWYVNSPGMASPASGLLSSYPLVFSGKPYWSLPANIPIIFELTVLLSAITAFVGVWALAKLPMFYYPAFTSARFRRVTDDKFFILIDASDSRFVLEQTRQILLMTEPAALEEVKD
jgi:hypothetical protein